MLSNTVYMFSDAGNVFYDLSSLFQSQASDWDSTIADDDVEELSDHASPVEAKVGDQHIPLL